MVFYSLKYNYIYETNKITEENKELYKVRVGINICQLLKV
jgi:hypothetical protein